MINLTCIVCPNGCELTVDEETKEVSGNRCPRGRQFALDEMTCPKRTICSSVKTVFAEAPVVSVRLSQDVLKTMIFDIMKEINKVTLTARLGIGDVVIANVLNSGADVIITSNILKESL